MRTIPPLLNLDYPNYEIIVVDNGSTDESVNYLKRFKKIKTIENKENLGYSKGKNIGIKNAKGQYVFLLDNDIVIDNKNVLKILLKKYLTYTHLAFITCLLVPEGQETTKMYGTFFCFYGLKMNNAKSINKIRKHNNYYVINPYGGAVFFKKIIWNYLGGFDESQPFTLNDFDIGIRSWILGYKNIIINDFFLINIGNKGINSRENNRSYCWKFKYYFSGHSKMIFKNLQFMNVIKIYPFFIIFSFSKMLRQLIRRKDICILKAYITSIFLFLMDLKTTSRKRKYLQNIRIEKDNIFMKIKSPYSY